jgi:hypothetical protein
MPFVPTAEERAARTEAARQAAMRNSAVRALDDPVKLARAARIVRTALERQRLELADVVPEDTADTAETANRTKPRTARKPAGTGTPANRRRTA